MVMVAGYGRGTEMLTALVSLVAANGLALTQGVIAGGVLEAVVPIFTQANRVRSAVNIGRRISRKFHNRDLTELEVQQISIDPTLTK